MLGLKDHPHWPLVVDFAKQLGLKGPLLAQLNLSCFANMHRPRLMMAWASDVELPDSIDIAEPEHRIHDAPLPPSMARYALRVDEKQLRILRDQSLLPHRDPVDHLVGFLGLSLAKRAMIWPGTVLPTLMASYGRQHLLPHKLLQENGLLTWLIYDERIQVEHPWQTLRYLQPCEALWLLGFPLFAPHPKDAQNAMHSSSWQFSFAADSWSVCHQRLTLFELECAGSIQSVGTIFCSPWGCTYSPASCLQRAVLLRLQYTLSTGSG